MSGEILILILLLIYFALSFIFIAYIDDKNKQRRLEEKREFEKKLKEEGYEKPEFKKLTQLQIDDIHSRGKITPEEKVKEWESLGLCAPGDAIGSAGWRCKKFHHNCHECLIEYANQRDEHISILDNLKIVNKI